MSEYITVQFFVLDKAGNSKGIHRVNVYENPQTCPGFNLIASRMIKDYVNRNGNYGITDFVRTFSHSYQSNVPIQDITKSNILKRIS